MSDIEIEIQVKIEHKKPLLNFLEKEGEFKLEDHQIDEYFTPPDHNFLAVRPVKEWLRLRDANGRYSLNYKNWHYNSAGKSTHCDEYETNIENLDKFRKIFGLLGYKSLVVVNKIRKTWTYKNYEIGMDQVKGLGSFVEIEYKGSTKKADPEKITAEMTEFLKNLGCGNIRRNYVGYPFQLLFGDEVNYEVQ